MTERGSPSDEQEGSGTVLQELQHAAAVLRSDEFRDHPLNELREGPYIRFGVARLLDSVAEALDHGQSVPQPVLDSARQIATHVLANRPR